MCDESGAIFVKPCTQAEIDFYESAVGNYPKFAEIMAKHMGQMSLMANSPEDIDGSIMSAVAGVISESGQVESSAERMIASLREQIANAPETPTPVDRVTWVPSQGKRINTTKSVVLENQTFGYKHANVLDLKLGTRLYADDAPEQKKERFDKISRETTHHNLGFRIAGMRVFRGSEDASELDDEEYKVYDKDYGRVTVNDDNVSEELKRFIFNKAAGIDEELGKAICAEFARKLAEVVEVMSSHESRMYSSSLLFVFEGHGDTLLNAIEKNNTYVEEHKERQSKKASDPRSTKRTDSAIGLDDEESDDCSDDNDSTESKGSLPPICSLKLIDFAHAAWTPGEGPDENTIKGVKALEAIFTEMAK